MTALTRLHRRDEGSTLMEMVIGMAVMSVFMALFTAVLYNITSASARTQSVWTTSRLTSTAFAQLDKSIRYASAISRESATANTNGNWYVEFQTTNTGSTVCTQLQLATGAKTLSSRTWTVDSTGASSTPTAFRTIVIGVSQNGSDLPFRLLADNNYDLEQLTISLAAPGTTTANSVPSTVNTTFTAANSAAAETSTENDSSAPAAVCNQKGRP